MENSHLRTGLESLVEKNQRAGRLHFTSDVKEAVEFGELQFIAVGTPSEKMVRLISTMF